MNDLQVWINNHEQNVGRQQLQFYYKELLDQFLITEIKAGLILEIGSGSGFAKNLIPSFDFYRSDYLFLPRMTDINFSAYSIPFKSETFQTVFMVDVLHHFQYPINALNEIHRILKNHGKIILIEPHVSFFSYLIYKFFHHEPTTFRISRIAVEDTLNFSADSADNGISTSLFLSSKWRSERGDLYKKFSVQKIRFVDFFSFFATGGLQRSKDLIPFKLYRTIHMLDRLLPNILLRFIGSRLIVVLEKK